MRRMMILLVLLLLVCPCRADYRDTSRLDNALSDEEYAFIEGQSAQNADLKAGTASLLQNAAALLRKQLKNACFASFSILGICALTAIAEKFVKSTENASAVKAVGLCGSFAAAYAALSGKGSLIRTCTAAVARLDSFSKIVTPTFALAAAVAKHPASAVATASATLIFTNIISTVTLKLIFPLVSVYTVSSLAASTSENETLGRLCGFIKWGVSFLYKVLLIGFTCYITMSGVISSSTDALSMKTAKAVISGTVPIIGGIVSDASDAILSGAALLKSGIGVFGFLGVCAVCLVPFVTALAYSVVFKLISFVASSFGGGALSKSLDGISTAYALSLGALGACCAVQFISIVVATAVTM